jgi:hypothetical protein
MQVCPGWLGTKEDCWEQMVRAWTTDEAYEARREHRERRLVNPPVAHKQGNMCLRCTWKNGYASVGLFIIPLNCHYL